MRLGRVRRLGRRGVAAVVVVLLAVVGTGAWLLTRPSGAAAAQQVTATVAAGTYQQTVSATGTLEPTRQADLDFAVSGRVTSVRVAAGDTVQKGDRLATLDTSSLDAALDLGAGPARRGAGAVRRRRGRGCLLHPARGRQGVRRGGRVRPEPGRGRPRIGDPARHHQRHRRLGRPDRRRAGERLVLVLQRLRRRQQPDGRRPPTTAPRPRPARSWWSRRATSRWSPTSAPTTSRR